MSSQLLKAATIFARSLGSRVQISVPAEVAKNSWCSSSCRLACRPLMVESACWMASLSPLYVAAREPSWSSAWAKNLRDWYTLCTSCCHSCTEYWVAFCVSLDLVIGSLIQRRVSSSHVCRIMAWSGVGTRSGGTARYHVGGMYPRSASMARSSHSRHDWLAGAGAMARSLWRAWCFGCSRSQWSGLRSPEVLVQQV